jgi:hypothetical protein
MSQSKFELPGAHGEVALIPRRRNGGRLGFAIRFLFAEQPIRGFREMSRYGADGLGMALAPGDALVEAGDMAVRVAAAHQTNRVRRFDERPYLKALRRPRPERTSGRGTPVCRFQGDIEIATPLSIAACSS